jgi:hypothetical protein
MTCDDKLTKVSMFLDGELSNVEMNDVEKIIDEDDDIKTFIINDAKACAYSKSFFRNEMAGDEIILPDHKKAYSHKFMLMAASFIFLVGIGILMSNLIYDRSGSNPAFTANLINPIYQNVLNTALENYKSGVQYKSMIPEIEMHITVIPEKTYKYNDGNYIRKFVISYDLGGKTIDAQGFAERKNKESWEIKTLTF